MAKQDKFLGLSGCGYIILTIISTFFVFLVWLFNIEGQTFFYPIIVPALALLIWIIYKVKEDREFSRKKAEFKKERARFISSNAYKYIKKFVGKYKTILSDINEDYIIKLKTPINKNGFNFDKEEIKWHIDSIIKLRTLIDKNGFNFDNEEIKWLIDKELRIQKYNSFKEKILYNDPKELEDYIKNLVDTYGENYEKYTEFFELLLEKEGIDCSHFELLTKISDIKNKIELDSFKRGLDTKDLYFVSIQEVDSFTGYEFEYFLKTLFKKMGYLVEHTKLSSDQGADLIISKLGKKTIVQAKRHTGKISNKAVQEVVASLKHYKAENGMVVTNNYFTKAAVELAKSNNIELIDRDELKKLIEKYL